MPINKRDSEIEQISLELCNRIIQQSEVERVTNGNPYAFVEINDKFLGFVDVYYHLSKIIPNEFTIIDFGCGYNAQSFGTNIQSDSIR